MKLTVENLCKSYGENRAVDHVSFQLEPGVHVLLGENGAGKTTLLRMLCGILKPTEGHISLDGLDVRCEEYRALLGYLPQQFGYYPHFTGWDFLLYMGALKGLDRPHAKRRAEEVLELVNLTDAAHQKIKTYSGGMKQRLGIAQALLGDPKLLVVDEPTSSLDPLERVRFRNVLAQWGQNSIVLFSTHIVADAEPVADDIFMMRHGSLICHEQWDKSRTDLETLYLNTFGGELS
ncbi:MAG: ABC transporter ATP-binding protein [Clostridiales bacterium]|nr:ABC transporter ATP-binding protein [Clostridiales bacterium]